jgi:hypothetical protein
MRGESVHLGGSRVSFWHRGICLYWSELFKLSSKRGEIAYYFAPCIFLAPVLVCECLFVDSPISQLPFPSFPSDHIQPVRHTCYNHGSN